MTDAFIEAVLSSLPPQVRVSLVLKVLAELRAKLRLLSEEDLVAVDKFLELEGKEGPAQAKIQADIKVFVRILMFCRREVEERCLSKAELASLEEAVRAEATAAGAI